MSRRKHITKIPRASAAPVNGVHYGVYDTRGGAAASVAILRVRNRKATLEYAPLENLPPKTRRKIAAGAGVTCALPPATGVIVPLDPPPLPPARRLGVLPGLLDLKLPFSLDACSYAFADTGKERPMGMAARHAELEKTLAELKQKNLDPQRCVPLEWALWRQSALEIPATDAPNRLILFTDQNDPDRIIAVAGKDDSYGSSAVINRADSTALKRIIAMAFGASADSILILCAGSRAGDLSRELSQSPPAPRCQIETVPDHGGFAARALAWDGARDPESAAQLRSGRYEHPAIAAQKRRKLASAAALAIIGALAMAAASVWARIEVAAENRRQNDILEQRLEAAAGYRPATRGEAAVREAEEALRERMDPVIERFIERDTVDTLGMVSRAAAASAIKLRHIEVKRRAVTLSGITDSAEKAREFEKAIGAGGVKVYTQIEKPHPSRGDISFIMTPEDE